MVGRTRTRRSVRLSLCARGLPREGRRAIGRRPLRGAEWYRYGSLDRPLCTRIRRETGLTTRCSQRSPSCLRCRCKGSARVLHAVFIPLPKCRLIRDNCDSTCCHLRLPELWLSNQTPKMRPYKMSVLLVAGMAALVSTDANASGPFVDVRSVDP